METLNQKLFMDFQQTITMLREKKAQLDSDITTVTQQLDNMRKEMANLDQAITMHIGGMSSIEVITQQGFGIVKYEGEELLALNPHQVAQPQSPQPQPQAPQAPIAQAPQYSQQPTDGIQGPPQPITTQAQETFAPANPTPSFGQSQFME